MTYSFDTILFNAINNPRRRLIREAFDAWDDALKTNDMLRAGRDLLQDLDSKYPGSENMIVGGTVRDLVLQKPIKDVDIATNVPIAKIEQEYPSHDIGKSKDFGIVTVQYKGHDFEVAAFRTEGKSSNSRHPDDVSFTDTYKDDSARRDLTINSLGVDANGEISDYHGGLADLKNKIIRTVGDPKQRFEEDALRIYRLYRFAAKLGFYIDPETQAAAKELVSKGHTDKLSVERVKDEMWKAAGSGNSLAAYVEHLHEAGILARAFPEIANLWGKQHQPEHHPEGDAFEHTTSALRASRSNDPLTNIAILFHDIGKGETYKLRDGKHSFHGHESHGAKMLDSIGSKLKLSNHEKNALIFAAGKHMLMHKAKELNKTTISGLVTSPYWDILKDVGYADEMARGPSLSDAGRYEDGVKYMEDVVGQYASKQELDAKLKSLITGSMIIEWFPDLMEPSKRPLISRIHKAIKDHLIDNDMLDASPDEIKQVAVDMYDRTVSAVTEKFSRYTRSVRNIT